MFEDIKMYRDFPVHCQIKTRACSSVSHTWIYQAKDPPSKTQLNDTFRVFSIPISLPYRADSLSEAYFKLSLATRLLRVHEFKKILTTNRQHHTDLSYTIPLLTGFLH